MFATNFLQTFFTKNLHNNYFSHIFVKQLNKIFMQNSTQSNEDDFMELFVKSSQLNLTKTQLVQIVSEAFLSGAFSANEHQDSSNFWQNLDKDKQIFLNEDLTEFLNKCWNDGF